MRFLAAALILLFSVSAGTGLADNGSLDMEKMANCFTARRDVFWFVRTPVQISEEAVKRGLPKDTWALSWFDGPMDMIMTPPPPDIPLKNRGWAWMMFQRDIVKWGALVAHEFKHLHEGHFHDIPKGKGK